MNKKTGYKTLWIAMLSIVLLMGTAIVVNAEESYSNQLTLPIKNPTIPEEPEEEEPVIPEEPIESSGSSIRTSHLEDGSISYFTKGHAIQLDNNKVLSWTESYVGIVYYQGTKFTIVDGIGVNVKE